MTKDCHIGGGGGLPLAVLVVNFKPSETYDFAFLGLHRESGETNDTQTGKLMIRTVKSVPMYSTLYTGNDLSLGLHSAVQLLSSQILIMTEHHDSVCNGCLIGHQRR